MTTVLVAGATGNVGGEVVRALAGTGEVRALSRRGAPVDGAVPVTCAESTSFSPLGLKSRSKPPTSGTPLTPLIFATSIGIESIEVVISGVKVVFVSFSGCRMPADAMLICVRSAVIGLS